MIFASLFFVSCQTTQSRFENSAEESKAIELIEKCINATGREATACRFEMADGFVATQYADIEVIDSEVIEENSDYKTVRYLVQKGYFVFYVILKEPKKNEFMDLVKNVGFAAVGIVLGYVIKAAAFAPLL